MRALIADDEPLLRHHLSKLLGEVTSDIEVVASVSDGLQAVEKIKELQPDVVFLDIRMPGLDGLAVAGAMKELGTFPHVVFVTAYDNYAIEAFEKGAIDYLVKPIDEGRLQKTCERLVSQHKEHDQRDELLKLLESTHDNKAPPLLWLKAAKGDDIHLIHVDDVQLFKAEDKYVTVVTADAEYLIRTPLRVLYQRLCHDTFWQIHRSAIVRVAIIARVSRDITGKMFVETTSGSTRLPVSRNAQSLFKQM
ncbi:LytR/AlgR family response regulator transcription factor [Enterovibrio norvegicus]|uniref:LytR/AlgR family response regulator transcription factor n=1 Tax=Enterovibrio norvegicus TaxID=188144 RepID=UPI000C82CB80|nr:LytTR family DNA-binding domain-containing protein [Enterovibrio norvegicus]PMN74102.1 DNA-binding response regulator [Enterovibrio norvegicus]